MIMSHLTIDDRILIQEHLDNKESIRSIAKLLSKAPSTILREIKNHRCFRGRKSQRTLAPCKKKKDCTVDHLCKDTHCYSLCCHCDKCMELCSLYEPEQCPKLDVSPYVCNGCGKIGYCTYDRYTYMATYAQNTHDEVLVSSREGINMEPEDVQALDDLISPLIKQGQPIGHVIATHSSEIGCSRSTVYNYIDQGVLTARNIDLPRRVKYKPRKKSSKEQKLSALEKLAIKDRDYEHFLAFLQEHPDVNVVEMDTVVGPVHSHKCLLTMLFRNCSLMIAFLLDNKTQEAVADALNWLCDEIGIDTFKRLFPVILTDRGSEFLYPEAIESDSYGEIKTRVFYCDPQCAWQKGRLERNHEFIRYVVPKKIGTFDNKTQEDITLMINHINSTCRDNLNGKSPYALSKLLLPDALHKALNLVEIPADKVVLKPSLLK
jgi:IS30 family transposase